MTEFMMLGVQRKINDLLGRSGISEPTEIQRQAVPLLLAGRDVIGQAQTGTGKTLAFLLPIMEKIDSSKALTQALVITPTRELALQISEAAAKLAGELDINVLAIYGGQDVERQCKQLKGGPQLIVGTPGRILDHLRRKTIYLSAVSMLVLDEADQMLHLGFLEEVEEVIRQTSAKRQMMLFSATMPGKVRALAVKYMRRPVDIRVQAQQVVLDEIKQVMLEVMEAKKADRLAELIREYNPYLAMVFCHTKKRASEVMLELAHRGFEVDELHGDLSQNKREQVLKRFREAKVQILVATDIAARGLDIEGVTHVFNYDIPRDVESYIHRIGRTGRAGESGVAVTLSDPHERSYVKMIEEGIKSRIDRYRPADQPVTVRETWRPSWLAEKQAKVRARRQKEASHGGTNLRSHHKPKTAQEQERLASIDKKRQRRRK